MITDEKLRIYALYGGNHDDWARMATASDKAAMLDADWVEIGGILEKLTVVERGLAAPDHAERVRAELRDLAGTAEVARRLQTLARGSR